MILEGLLIHQKVLASHIIFAQTGHGSHVMAKVERWPARGALILLLWQIMADIISSQGSCTTLRIFSPVTFKLRVRTFL